MELRYFDDVSRFSRIDEWLSKDDYIQRRVEKKASGDKMEMMKNRILGYDAASASQLTVKEGTKGSFRFSRLPNNMHFTDFVIQIFS